MKYYLKMISFCAVALLLGPDAAFAKEGAAGAASLYVPIGAGIAMGIAALGGTLAQGKAIGSALESIGRNPSAAGKITTPMYVGLAFVESLVIISFVIAYSLLG